MYPRYVISDVALTTADEAEPPPSKGKNWDRLEVLALMEGALMYKKVFQQTNSKGTEADKALSFCESKCILFNGTKLPQ